MARPLTVRDVQRVRFAQLNPAAQAGYADRIKQELEQRLAVSTRPVDEWVRVLVLANPELEINAVLGTFSLGAGKETADRLAREYLVMGEQTLNREELEWYGFAFCIVCGDPLLDDNESDYCDQCHPGEEEE